MFVAEMKCRGMADKRVLNLHFNDMSVWFSSDSGKKIYALKIAVEERNWGSETAQHYFKCTPWTQAKTAFNKLHVCAATVQSYKKQAR